MTTPAHGAVASLLAQAAEGLEAAVATAYLLADDNRQKAEERAGGPAADEAVLDDPEYVAVLRRCGRLNDLADAARKAQEEWA